MKIVTLTEKAAHHVLALLEAEQKQDTHALRVKVVGGGCSGLQYQMMFDEAKADTDVEQSEHGVHVRIDEKSALYLTGASIDYADGLMESGFQIQNPNAKNSCGCGQSFGA